jgi:two-component system NtrC family sensor kinase
MIHRRKSPLLYVDDTVEQRYAMRRILEIEGYEVLEAGTGTEALELMEKQPCLVILDVKLPDMSGYEVCRRIKAMTPAMAVLQVSASFSDPTLRASGLSGGADAYIAQPVHPAELLTLVRRLITSSEAEQTLRFLSAIGPRLSSTLSFPKTIEQTCQVFIPHFADHCALYVPDIPGEEGSFWSDEGDVPGALRALLQKAASEQEATMLAGSMIIAPLAAARPGFGAIAFLLDSEREYTPSDLFLALDLANRAGLALQNCVLFSAEQSTRAALIESEKLATAGRMAAAIAHEINNPLEAVTNLVFIIQQSPEASEFIREHATSAISELSRLTHIARQSLGFYRELSSPIRMDLNESVSDTVDLYRGRFMAKQIEVETKLAPDLFIHAIRGEIRQVISNLLVNALDAMEKRGTLTVTTEQEDSQVTIRVSDNGLGIRPEDRAKIFDAFFTTKRGTGTGLGLWISRSIVEKHGGTITMSSSAAAEDHGTTFMIAFPAAAA